MFLSKFKDCLTAEGTSFADIKPENIGVKMVGGFYVFRVIDIDSLGTRTATPGYTLDGDARSFFKRVQTVDYDIRAGLASDVDMQTLLRLSTVFGMICIIALACLPLSTPKQPSKMSRSKLYNDTLVGKKRDTKTGAEVKMTNKERLNALLDVLFIISEEKMKLLNYEVRKELKNLFMQARNGLEKVSSGKDLYGTV